MKKSVSLACTAMVVCMAGSLVWADCGACGPKETQKDAAAKPACVGCKGGVKCAACAAKALTAEEAQGVKVSTDELKALIADGKATAVFDARSGKWDDGNRIPGAAALSPEASAEDVLAAAPEKDALIVTYCSGLKCSASAALAKHLRELGYSNVKEYPNGIAGWVEAGNEVEKAEM